jgi:hypothetical protein
MFSAPGLVSAVPRVSGPVFMFCAPGFVFMFCGTGGTDGVGSRFPVLRAQTRFRPYPGCRVLFSCFALPESFSAVLRALGPILMFSTPGQVFGGTEGVRSLFHVLRARTRFLLYRRRRDLFTCFALLNSFSAVPRASGPVYMFCAPELVFGCTEGVGSRFHVLRGRTHFRQYRGRGVPF